MRRRGVFLAILAVWSSAVCAAGAAQGGDPATMLRRIGLTRGVCVVPGDRECRVAIGLAQESDLVLYVPLVAADEEAAACRAADAAGLYGTRIFIDRPSAGRIGLADNVADAVVAPDGVAVDKAEALRVLRPEGRAMVAGEVWTKPIPEGVDDWSHHYHGPDNNPQSRDRLARAPYLTQFVAEPRYAPAPQAAVASGGRVFMAFGHIAWKEREEPWMNTLVAINGYNGTMLWKRALVPGIMVDRPTMVATPSVLYLADDKSCKRLEAATGQLKDEITLPAGVADGTFWKWIALEGGVLYGLVGQDEKQDPDARWRRTAHGWPWSDMSKGYNDPKFLWGFAKTLVAMDPQTKQVLWTHREDPAIDGRALAMGNGRLYLFHFGRYLKCLDAKTGKVVWQRTADKDPDVFQAMGPYRPEQGPIGGWKTNIYLKCTDRALYFVGPEVPWLTALSAGDGRFLWKHPAKDLHLVIRDDALYTIGPATAANDTKKLDPISGAVLATYQIRRRSCTRATGSADSIFFRGHEGTGRFEVGSGQMAWTSAVRPSCQIGVLVAHGHLYWVPWACDCNLQIFGAVACCPAGDFGFAQKAVASERLQQAADARVAPSKASPRDWPTYRADNARTARTEVAVPGQVKVLWQFSPPKSIEPTAPVAAGKLVFVAGADGIVRGLEAATGKVRWTAYTGGAVRYPPTIAEGRALVGSADGWAYAFEAATGKLLWRFRAAPAERRIAFYGALASTWPVASGVLVDKGVAYFAAGMNDFDGSHVYALDAATGQLRWQNNTSGHLDPIGRRGVTCQGEMLLDGGRFYLAGGNTVSPGVFDAATGQCLNSPPTSLGAGAPRGRELHLVKGQVRVVGQPLYSRSEAPVFDPSVRWDDPVVTAANARLTLRASKAQPKQRRSWVLAAEDANGGQLWQQSLSAEPVRWGLAVDAEGRVLVALRDGRILCFGSP